MQNLPHFAHHATLSKIKNVENDNFELINFGYKALLIVFNFELIILNFEFFDYLVG